MFDPTDFGMIQQDWLQKTGDLPFPMTNDYLFRAMCQKDNSALKSLICSILHWDKRQVISIDVTNPILLGKAIDDKEFILDVHVCMNNNITLNLEMQVFNNGDWPERSLMYLCRQFDQLCSGGDYEKSKSAIHIGILNFDPFKGQSRLRESYRMMGEETHLVYTDRFQLYTLCLPRAEQAEAADVHYHTNAWANYFTAKTWEELKMAAREDEGIASAVTTVRALWEDTEINARMQAREEYYRQKRRQQAQLEEAERKQAEAEKELEKVKKKCKELQEENERLRRQIGK